MSATTVEVFSREQYTELDHVCKQVLHLLVTELVHQISTVVGISLSAYVQQGWISNGINTNSILLVATDMDTSMCYNNR